MFSGIRRWDLISMFIIMGAITTFEFLGVFSPRMVTITQIIKATIPMPVRIMVLAWLTWHFCVSDIESSSHRSHLQPHRTKDRKMKVQFPKQDLLNMLWEDVDVVQDTIVDTSRWSVIHEFIFKKDDKLYRTSYSVGATEQQDERPWEYDTLVDCWEVEAYERVVTGYREVDI